jgi:hypothetical protein
LVLAVWSPKGGTGTSVVAAGLAVVLSHSRAVRGVRLADAVGDQPSIFGLPDPADGLATWLAGGCSASDAAFDRVAVTVRPRLQLVARGAPYGPVPGDAGAGRALVAALSAVPTVLDAGVPRDPAVRAAVAAADVNVLVLRRCYLALRGAVRDELLSTTAGYILIDDGTRAIRAHDITGVIGVPLLARVPLRESIARAVDAGLFAGKVPRDLSAAMRRVLERIGFVPGIKEGLAA